LPLVLMIFWLVRVRFAKTYKEKKSVLLTPDAIALVRR
jgi:hypothetical protein